MSGLNWVDNIILVMFLVSILAGLMRGLVREMIALLTWAAAFVISILFSSKVAAAFSGNQAVQSMANQATNTVGMNAGTSLSMLSIGASFIGLFVGTIIVGSVVNYFVSSAVEGRGISFSNRLLGGIFGLARGFLIVLLMIFLIQLSPLSDQPYWKGSQFVHSFQPIIKVLNDMVAPGLATLKNKVGDTFKNVNPGEYLQNLRGGGNP